MEEGSVREEALVEGAEDARVGIGGAMVRSVVTSTLCNKSALLALSISRNGRLGRAAGGI